MKNLALLLFAAVLLAVDAPPPKGTLCIAKECRSVEGTTIVIAPSEASRNFVWTSSDAKTIAIGAIAAKAESIDLADKELRDVKLGLRGSAARGWPVETTFSIATKPAAKPDWTWTIPAKLVPPFVTVRMRRGEYVLAVAAPHHRTTNRRVKVEASQPPMEVALAPLPVVSGHVVTATEKGDVAVAGANVFRADGKLAGPSNEQGAFRIELEEPVPETITVSAPGLGSKIVSLPSGVTDHDAGTIKLAPGHMLTLHVKRPEGFANTKIHLSVADAERTRMQTAIVASRDLAGVADDDVAIPDLSNGTYLVTLSGSDSLEHLAQSVTIKDEDVQTTITIAPYRLDGSAHIGNDPIADAKVGFNDRTGWHAEMPIVAGHFGAVLWQPGVLRGWVMIGGTPQLVVSPELGANPSVWDIALPDRRISGRVIDAETNAPIDDAQIGIQITTAGGPTHTFKNGYFNTKANPDGTYMVLTPEAGTYELRVSAPDHLNDMATFEVGENDSGPKSHDFLLGRGVETVIEVVTPSGHRIGGAEVLEGVSSDGHNPDRYYSTDGDGRLSLRFHEGETKTLSIVPRQGSFVVARVAAAKDGKLVQVVVPPPVGGLNIVAKPPGFAVKVIRYNGELLTPPLTMRLDFKRLPAGAYDVWLVTLPKGAGIERLINYVPTTPPARAGVSAGETVLEVVPVPLP